MSPGQADGPPGGGWAGKSLSRRYLAAFSDLGITKLQETCRGVPSGSIVFPYAPNPFLPEEKVRSGETVV